MTPVETSSSRQIAPMFPLPCQTSPVRVDFGQFLELLVSRRQLSRVDSPDRGLYGLLDHKEGCWYVVPDREFDHWQSLPR